jgi:Domain of unknown function (DUF1858)
MNKLQITPEIKISELLDNFPELESKLFEIAPPFKKLKNPALKKSLAKVTTLRQVSKIAEISLSELINGLRTAAGQNEITIEKDKSKKDLKPEWVKEENIKFTYDARIDLENGNHPAAKVSSEILALNKDELYLLVTPFLPGPLVEIIKEKGFEVYSTNKSSDEIHTFIKPSNK